MRTPNTTRRFQFADNVVVFCLVSILFQSKCAPPNPSQSYLSGPPPQQRLRAGGLQRTGLRLACNWPLGRVRPSTSKEWGGRVDAASAAEQPPRLGVAWCVGARSAPSHCRRVTVVAARPFFFPLRSGAASSRVLFAAGDRACGPPLAVAIEAVVAWGGGRAWFGQRSTRCRRQACPAGLLRAWSRRGRVCGGRLVGWLFVELLGLVPQAPGCGWRYLRLVDVSRVGFGPAWIGRTRVTTLRVFGCLVAAAGGSRSLPFVPVGTGHSWHRAVAQRPCSSVPLSQG